MTEKDILRNQLEDITYAANIRISDIKPSEWIEKNMYVKGQPYRFDYTPYIREIVDRLAPDDPSRKIVFMKGSQVGGTLGVIMGGLGWMIQNQPGNTYLMVGSPDLIPNAVERFDFMAQESGIKELIYSQVQRNRSQKTGDTNTKKDYPGGYLYFGHANNHKNIAQVDLRYLFLDDLDQMKGTSLESGDLLSLIEKRMSSYETTYKEFLISTPLLKATSNIEPAFLKGDQRFFNIPCPCCHEKIVLNWTVKVDEKNTGGIVWQTDNHGNLIEKSVGYVCQLCAGFFKDSQKQKIMNSGLWLPTANPIWEGYYSYHLSTLYAAAGMFGWVKSVREYVECTPPNQPRNENIYKTFVNTRLGLTYELPTNDVRATDIMKNIRPYNIGMVPESLSIADGNGKIVLITLGSDCNGKMKPTHDDNDARLDWEIVAHSENGSTYSIEHGSIGTFKPLQGNVVTDRIHWTYEHNKPNSVWTVFELLLNRKFKTDTGREMPIGIAGIDIGAYSTNAVYPFLDKTNFNIVGVKGEKELTYFLFNKDTKTVKRGLERNDIYILQVGLIKDKISQYMQLKWDKYNEKQPPYFMNFPEPAGGLYGFENYFEHYESEQRVLSKNSAGQEVYRWEKKNSASQNHLFDCRVYNIALKEVLVLKMAKEFGLKEFSWEKFVEVTLLYYEKT